jgi:hypothetical protein
MAERARIYNTAVLKDVKGALAEFAESVNQTLAGVDAEIARWTQWLNQEQIGHWKREVRRTEEAITRCKSEIQRKKLIAHPEPASTVFEEKQLRKAKARLDQAQRKLANVRKWAPVWEREALLYKTATSGLMETINGNLPLAMARLERMLTSLEEYERMAPPPGDAESGIRLHSQEDAAGEVESE